MSWSDDFVTIHHGDCLIVMAGMDADSIDAIVTDPPYGLSFMGREWDHGVPGEAFWAEALRVAKPGAHLVAFGGTRTYHRLAVAIEDAGWEVRDCLGWLYGSGFPKSLDVSKAIDKGYGENRARQLEFTAWMRSTGVTAAQINAATDSFMGSHYLTDKEQAAIATADMFDRLRHLLPDVPEHIERLVAERTGIEWTAYVNRPITQEAKRASVAGEVISFDQRGSTERERRDIPSTEAAQRWQGWGTALKPAWEPIILARKPLTSTVAGNVQRWGTGALNIDATRVPTSQDDARSSRAGSTCDTCPLREVSPPSRSEDTHTRGASVAGHADRSVRLANASVGGSSGQSRTGSRGDCRPSAHSDDGPPRLGEGADRASALPQDGADEPHGHLPDKRCIHAGLSTCPQYTTPNVEQQGRWPANIVHDGSDEVLAVFPQTDGGNFPARLTGRSMFGLDGLEQEPRNMGDSGSAARFFYTAKASKSERDEGLADSRNIHPTVKPLDLMRWLVRLVTPPDGVVLDPFMGSGTTLKAARAEGHRSIGIDLEREHCEIAWGRLSQGVLL